MNQTNSNFKKQSLDTAKRAAAMTNAVVSPALTISDEGARRVAIEEACANDALLSSMLQNNPKECLGILLSAAAAVSEHHKVTGQKPTDEQLASVHGAWENMYQNNDALAESSKGHALMSSVGSATTATESGIAVRATSAALTLPAILANPMNVIATYLPTSGYEAEVFDIKRVAGTTLGDYKKGQELTGLTAGQYSRQRQRFAFPAAQQPDSTKKQHTFTAKTDTPAKIELPVHEGAVEIYHNKIKVAQQTQSGDLYGKIEIGGEVINVTGTVDTDTCAVVVDTSKALPTGSTLEIRFHVRIEGNKHLIPTVTHKMTSFKLKPTARVLSSQSTIMSNFAMMAEHGVDLFSLNLSSVRDEIVNEKSLYQLIDLLHATTENEEFSVTPKANETWKDRFEYFKVKFLSVENKLRIRNKESGVRAIYAGIGASSFFEGLPTSIFKPVTLMDNNVRIKQIGTFLGRIPVFQVPQSVEMAELGDDEMLLAGRSDKIGKAPYLTGDVVPPTIFKSDDDNGLTKNQLVWANGYDDTAPDAHKFLVKLKLKDLNA